MPKIYTKTGDDGTTGLLSGGRVKKSHARLEAYGQVDHLNSHIGLLKCYIEKKEIQDDLSFIQNKLFNLGSLLACPAEEIEKLQLRKIDIKNINRIERSIDQMEEVLPKLTNFILPAGTRSSALAHLCRTQARNVERKMVDIELTEGSLEFVNRLSDYFFSLARYLNHIEGEKEVIWKA